MTTMGVMDSIPHLLWTTSWQAGVMAGAIWLACRQWPRMPANLRVMLWWLVSLKFVLGLVWTQPILLPILPAATTGTRSIGSNDLIADGSHPAMSRLERGDNPFRNQSKPLSLGEGVGEWVVSLWLLGVFVQGVLLVRQLVRTRQLIARSQPVEGDAAELFDDLAVRLGVRASQPRLRVSTAIGTPQVTGLARPVILLPVEALESFSTHELSMTLCHELMHVKRFDLWHGWIPSIAARLFFFHPLARLAAREYAIVREAACDARVLAFMGAPAYDYGRLLMRLGITAREAAPAAASASPTLHTLKRRLLMLHDASSDARGLSPRWWALAAIAALVVIPMRPTAAQRQPPNAKNTPNVSNTPNVFNTPNVSNRPNVSNGPNVSNRPDVSNETQDESWVFLLDDENSATHGGPKDVAEAKRLRANRSEPLIWFKRDGHAYVIRDRETLEKARALFIPQEQGGKTMRQLEERQILLRAQESELHQQEDALREQLRDVDKMVNEAAAAVKKTIAPAARPSEDARRMVVEELRQREIHLAQMEARRRDVTANQEVLGMQQRALGQQQAALGEEQAALGRQLEELHREMEREMRNLFEQALAAGVAAPIK
jgi:bla regulator protein BlaR1